MPLLYYFLAQKSRYFNRTFNIPNLTNARYTDSVLGVDDVIGIPASSFPSCPKGGVTTNVYTATSDGFLMLVISGSWNEDYAVQVWSTNGTTSCMSGYRFDDYNGNTERTSYLFPIKKNEVVKIWNNGGSVLSFPNGATLFKTKKYDVFNQVIKY